MAASSLGYYIHHDGSGHMTRALAIINHMTVPVVVFSSMKLSAKLADHVTFIQLPDDAVKDFKQPPDSLFLYTPYSSVILQRYQLLLKAVQKFQIRAMFVDVSPEIVLFSKVIGLKVGTTLMHGIRTDQSHQLAYDAADLLLSHNAQSFDTPANYQTRTHVQYAGGISKLKKKRSVSPLSVHSILVVTSKASSTIQPSDIVKSALSFPNITWHVVGAIDGSNVSAPNIHFHGVVEDVSPFYSQADIVIGSGGNNTIMEAASQQEPFVCIPDHKPFNEQEEAGRSLNRLNAAIVEQAWPSAKRIKEILDTYHVVDTDVFYSLVDDNASARAADIIQSLLTSEPR